MVEERVRELADAVLAALLRSLRLLHSVEQVACHTQWWFCFCRSRGERLSGDQEGGGNVSNLLGYKITSPRLGSGLFLSFGRQQQVESKMSRRRPRRRCAAAYQACFLAKKTSRLLGKKLTETKRRKSSQVEQIRSVGCRDGLGLNSVANWPVHLIYAIVYFTVTP